MAVGVRSKRWWVIGSTRLLRHGFGVIDVVALGVGLVFEDGPRIESGVMGLRVIPHWMRDPSPAQCPPRRPEPTQSHLNYRSPTSPACTA